MLTIDQIDSNRNKIYPQLVKLTKKRGVLDLWGVYFWSVKDDFKIFLNNWKGIRFIKDIIAFWDEKMILTFIDKFPIITPKEIKSYCVFSKDKEEFKVNDFLYREILEKYCALVILINENKKIESLVFPVLTTSGIVIAKLQCHAIFKIKIEELSKNTIRAPKNCPINVKILDFYEKIFFINEEGKVKIVFCTTNENNVIERMKILSLKDLSNKIRL